MSKLLGTLSLLTSLLLSAAYAQKPTLVGEVALSLSEQVQYEIRWQTLLPSIGQVEYGLDDSYGRVTAAAPALEGEHVHLLTDLAPGATYHYRLVTRDWAGNETVGEDQTFVAAAVTPVAQPGGAATAANAPLVDDSFENGLDESTWRVYSNTESGELAVEDGQLNIQNVGNGTDYGQLGLALLEPIDLTQAPTTVTVSYTETGNAEQNPGFWNVVDLEGDDNWNHPGIRATVSGEGISPTATPPAEGSWTPAEGVEGLQAPYTLTWTITPPEGEGEFSSTMQVDGEEIYSGTFDPGSFNPQEAYFYLYVSTPTEEGTTAIDAVTVEQEGQGGAALAAAPPEPTFEPGVIYPVTQGSLQVNGDLAELEGTTGISLEEHAAVQMEPYGGPEDLGGNIWLRWDEENLYLAARVQDDVHAQEFAEADMWQGDSLQLSLAAAAPGEAEGSYEYGFALTEDGPQVWRWIAPEGVETGAVENAGLEVTRDDEAGTTLYEVALPWAELAPLNAETGPTYSFSFIANDNDGDGRKGWVEVGSGVGGDKDPSLFLPFELAADATVATAPAAPQPAQASEDPAIFRTAGPITVDGDLSDWSQKGPITVDPSMVTDVPEVDNDSDLSAVAHFAYDDERLYFGADVTDDTLIFERTGDAIWQTDAVEFWLGGEQLGAAISERDNQPDVHAFGGLDLEEAEVAVAPRDGGYTVEVAIPVEAIEASVDVTVEAGSSLPVAVGVDDADEEGSEREGQIYFPEGWTFGDTNTFETLEFAP